MLKTLERAIVIAATAHAGAKDKGGHPYILHPLRVMLAVESREEKIVAVLHDVVEDTDWTLGRLRQEEFSDTVLQALDALTRRENEDYFAFVRRARINPIARTVKLADLADNMNLSRIPSPTAQDLDRINKYKAAATVLRAEDKEEFRPPDSSAPENSQ
jgi:(p)ppGpp synthase/HD superfamily hydrolase